MYYHVNTHWSASLMTARWDLLQLRESPTRNGPNMTQPIGVANVKTRKKTCRSSCQNCKKRKKNIWCKEFYKANLTHQPRSPWRFLMLHRLHGRRQCFLNEERRWLLVIIAGWCIILYILLYIMLHIYCYILNVIYNVMCIYIYINIYYIYILWLFKSLRTGSHGLFSSMNSDGSSTKHGDDRKLC